MVKQRREKPGKQRARWARREKVKKEKSRSEDSDDKDEGGMTFTSLYREAHNFGYRRCSIIYLMGLPEGLTV